MDSPRGRIYLMGAGLDGAPLDDTMVRHFDQCLGCMACVTACPSGVQYGKLIEATRPQVERRHRRPMKERLLRESMFALFPYPARLRALRGPLRLAQRAGLANGRAVELLPRRLRLMAELAPKLGPPPHIPARTPAMGTRRRTVGLLLGCVQRAFFPDVNAATVRVLSAEGCEVVVPPAAGCCGALSAHSGREPEALEFAKRTIQAFEDAGVDTVVTNAAGCGSNIKDYGWLLRDEPGWAERAQALAERTRDVVELLTELPQAARRYPLELRVAYHDACHLAHAQGVRRQPREMLRSIPGMELVDIPEGEICCGSAGVYNLLQPRPAAELGERKARHVVAVDPELLVTANPGCWMQIGRHAQALGYLLPVAHTVQVLDASIRGIPASSLRQQALHGPGTMLPRRS
jgi:glycolate oxidase iron-sulfur subunit